MHFVGYKRLELGV